MDEIPANRADPLVERVYSTTYVVHSSFAGLEIGLLRCRRDAERVDVRLDVPSAEQMANVLVSGVIQYYNKTIKPLAGPEAKMVLFTNDGRDNGRSFQAGTYRMC
ncbi:hypothetical protein N7471_002627 [Penicillium samsonianum]|uniref:uncharacterized protein n=1 Tax=Penicillium samsonianum TaxID=1882272 RepID=UPI0025466DEE|nr:uncharacterized protein N7471_002627 [Penicillium samsonianum]KAJ6143174.1 hypothetical protein N7471_002627 [Penicillium samsonianum]